MKYLFLLFTLFFSCINCKAVTFETPKIAPVQHTDTRAMFKSVAQLAYFSPIGGGFATGFAITDHSLLTAGHFCSEVLQLSIMQGLRPEIAIRYVDESGTISTELGFEPARLNTVDDVCVITRDKPHSLLPVQLEQDYDNNVQRGDKVFLLGGPLKVFPVLRDGYVGSPRGLEYEAPLNGKLFTSAIGWPGNSGSPIFSESGKVIGMMTATLINPKSPQDGLTMVISMGPTADKLVDITRDLL